MNSAYKALVLSAKRDYLKKHEWEELLEECGYSEEVKILNEAIGKKMKVPVNKADVYESKYQLFKFALQSEPNESVETLARRTLARANDYDFGILYQMSIVTRPVQPKIIDIKNLQI